MTATCKPDELDTIDKHGDKLGKWSRWKKVKNSPEWEFRQQTCSQCGQDVQETRRVNATTNSA